jgi:GNAT superfamily N-acetyltransferase
MMLQPILRPDPQSAVVRLAGPSDEHAIYQLLQLSYRENALLPANNGKTMAHIKCFLWSGHRPPEDTASPRGVVAVIGPVGGPLEAFAILALDTTWYSDAPILSEWAVFVHPHYRRTGHATALHAWMKGQAAVTRLPLITGILAPDRLEAKCRLYRRRFTKTGDFFVHLPPFYQCQADLSALVVASSSAVG